MTSIIYNNIADHLNEYTGGLFNTLKEAQKSYNEKIKPNKVEYFRCVDE